MELAVLVVKGTAGGVLLTGAQTAEVLRGDRGGISKELYK